MMSEQKGFLSETETEYSISLNNDQLSAVYIRLWLVHEIQNKQNVFFQLAHSGRWFNLSGHV